MSDRKLPKIPSELIVAALSGQPDSVIAGFMRLVMFLCDRRKPDVPIEEERLARISGLSAAQWHNQGKVIKELFLTFQTPFLYHWQRRIGINAQYMPLVIKAKEAKQLRARLREAKKLQDKDLSGNQSLLMHKTDKGVLTDWEQSGRFDPIERQDAIKSVKESQKTPFKPKLTDS